MASKLKAPFPWFGGKSRVADIVWQRFGDVKNYVEPFFGSGAVLLGRPPSAQNLVEPVNDKDCFVANFWRALSKDADAVAWHADWPVNEADLHARHLWLIQQGDWAEKMKTNPDLYDAKIAGWWVWGQCAWIGHGWCAPLGLQATRTQRKMPHFGDAGQGVNRIPSHQMPHFGNAGQVINRTTLSSDFILEYMRQLAARLRRVRVFCGDWTRLTGPSMTTRHGLTGIFLDPPYSGESGRVTKNLYNSDSEDVAARVQEWAVEIGKDPLARVALCGFEGDFKMPRGWVEVPWKAVGGYGLQGQGAARVNAGRERVWFSPHCLKP
jgi:DNA adenine methylase